MDQLREGPPGRDSPLAKLSARARELFGYLADRPGGRFTGEQLAKAVDIPSGGYGVAGVLAWPGRYCIAMGRALPGRYDNYTYEYWMEPDAAEVLREARDSM